MEGYLRQNLKPVYKLVPVFPRTARRKFFYNDLEPDLLDISLQQNSIVTRGVKFGFLQVQLCYP